MRKGRQNPLRCEAGSVSKRGNWQRCNREAAYEARHMFLHAGKAVFLLCNQCRTAPTFRDFRFKKIEQQR